MKTTIQTLLFAIAICGCAPRDKNSDVFRQENSDYVLLIAVSEEVTESDHAYQYMLMAIDKYFQDRIGTNDQIMIARIEGIRPLVWKGTPRALRKDFPNPESFRQAVLASGRETGSLNDGLVRSLKMVMKTYSVAKGKAKAVTMIMSSMNDPQPSAESDARFIEQLVKYWQAGGQIAFYFVDQLRIEDIEEKTVKAGMTEWVSIEPDANGYPYLPEFE